MQVRVSFPTELFFPPLFRQKASDREPTSSLRRIQPSVFALDSVRRPGERFRGDGRLCVRGGAEQDRRACKERDSFHTHSPSLFIRAFSRAPSSAGYLRDFAMVPFSFASDHTMLSPAGTTFGLAANTGSPNASSASIRRHPFALYMASRSPRKRPLKRLKCIRSVCFTGRPRTRRASES